MTFVVSPAAACAFPYASSARAAPFSTNSRATFSVMALSLQGAEVDVPRGCGNLASGESDVVMQWRARAHSVRPRLPYAVFHIYVTLRWNDAAAGGTAI